MIIKKTLYTDTTVVSKKSQAILNEYAILT